MLIEKDWPQGVVDSRKGSLWAVREFMLRRPRYFRQLVSRVSAALKLDPSGTYAEFGCGSGLLSLELAATGAKFYSTDISPVHLRSANTVAQYFGVRVEFVVVDAQYPPFADETLDGVVAVNVFEHLADRDVALDGMIRALKPGGWLTIEDGNLLRLKGVFDLLFLYPLRSRGKSGGIDWLLNHGKVRVLYGGQFVGRDEDWKTIWWWRRYLARFSALSQVTVSTTKQFDKPTRPPLINLFSGGIRAVAQKRCDR